MRGPRHPFLLLALLLGACAPRPIRLTVAEGSSARAISLLGDTLWAAPVDPRDGPKLVTQLQIARAMVSADPEGLDAQLTLARRTAAVGQLREAVTLLSQTAHRYYLDPRVLRYRGEVLLGLRELGQAYRDFEKAQDLLDTGGLPSGSRQGGAARQPRATDTTSLRWGMMVESDDAADSTGLVFTSVQFQVAFYMGVIRYLEGDNFAARDRLTAAAQLATNDDDLVQAALWLFFATRRIGNGPEAADILAAVGRDWKVTARRPEHQMLLGFSGEVPSDTIQARALARIGGDERTLYCYGIGYLLLATGRTDEAVLWLEQARTIPNWTALPYLAAEADLARLQGSKRKGG